MAVKYLQWPDRKPSRTFLTGGLFLLHATFASLVEAAEQQYACQASATGGWACTSSARPASMPPRPNSDPAAYKAADGRNVTLVTETKGKALASRSADYSHLDWVPRDKLSAAQQAEIAPYCAGTYVEPTRPGMFDKTPKDEAPIHVSARASRHDQLTESSMLAGDVVMRQGSMQAQAEEARFYRQEDRGELSGNVRLRDNGVLIVGDQADLALGNGEARVKNAEYVIHPNKVRGSALYAKREDTSIIRLKDGTFTRCEPGDNTWYLHGNTVTLNPITGDGEATNVTIRVRGLPVFYTPYLDFPIDDRRKSGFLTPSFGSSSNGGFGFLTPYYFNLAPNFDATLYPQYMANRGMLMEGEFRYLTDNTEGQVGAAYINDKETRHQNQSLYQKQRWMYNWQHKTGLASRWMADVDYTDISDPYYFQDLNTNLKVGQSYQLDQKAYLTYRGDSFAAIVGMHRYERANVTDITPYNRMPHLMFNGELPFRPGGLVMNYSTEFVRFQRSLRSGSFINKQDVPEQWFDDRLKGLSRADASRIHVEPAISLPLDWTWGFIKPSVKYSYTSYNVQLDSMGKASLASDERYSSNPTRSIPMFSIDSGLYFDRETEFSGQSFHQTLEPRLFYLYVPRVNQDDIPIFDSNEYTFNYSSLWRDNRFSGRDRIGDANQVALGVTTRLIEPNGFERQRFSIGQIYYFRDREIQLPGINYKDRNYATAQVSPIAMEYAHRYNQDWRFTSTLNWDPDAHITRSSSAVFHYQPADNLNKIFNIGYRYRRDTMRFDPATSTWRYDDDLGSKGAAGYVKDYYKISQHDVSTMWPLAPQSQWSAIGRWQYDYNSNRTLDAFGGFEYDSCCWKLRMIGRYWLNYNETSLNLNSNDKANTGFFLEIVLKGLGTPVGGQAETFLNNGIEGYLKREQQAF